MHYLLTKLLQFNIQAKDGEMGKIKDIYVDEFCNIRYAIVDTRKWLPERKVLLPPSSFEAVNEVDENLEVDYDKEMIRKSPPVPEETILTMEEENQLSHYFGWSRYWPNNAGFRQASKIPGKENSIAEEENENQNQALHSWLELIGSRVHATDGKLGRLNDLIFNQDWQITFLIVQTNDREKTGYCLFPVEAIHSVDWQDGDFYLKERTAVLNQKLIFQKKEDAIDSFV